MYLVAAAKATSKQAVSMSAPSLLLRVPRSVIQTTRAVTFRVPRRMVWGPSATFALSGYDNDRLGRSYREPRQAPSSKGSNSRRRNAPDAGLRSSGLLLASPAVLVRSWRASESDSSSSPLVYIACDNDRINASRGTHPGGYKHEGCSRLQISEHVICSLPISSSFRNS